MRSVFSETGFLRIAREQLCVVVCSDATQGNVADDVQEVSRHHRRRRTDKDGFVHTKSPGQEKTSYQKFDVHVVAYCDVKRRRD